jgi:hypothetical protein
MSSIILEQSRLEMTEDSHASSCREGQVDAVGGRTGWRSMRLAGSFALNIECRVAEKLVQFSGLLAEKMGIDELVIEAMMPNSVSLMFIYQHICESARATWRC